MNKKCTLATNSLCLQVVVYTCSSQGTSLVQMKALSGMTTDQQLYAEVDVTWQLVCFNSGWQASCCRSKYHYSQYSRANVDSPDGKDDKVYQSYFTAELYRKP